MELTYYIAKWGGTSFNLSLGMLQCTVTEFKEMVTLELPSIN